MKRVISCLFALLACVAASNPLYAQQQEVSFVRGQKLAHMLSVCLDEKVAVSILDADAKDGFEAASAIWNMAKDCASVPVMGPTVGKVIKSAKVKRGDKTVTARVVQILNGDQVIGYFFTTSTVDERNS